MNIWTSKSKKAVEARMQILDELFEEHVIEPMIERGEVCCQCRKGFDWIAERTQNPVSRVQIDGGPEYPNGLWFCDDCNERVQHLLRSIAIEERTEFSWAEVRDA